MIGVDTIRISRIQRALVRSSFTERTFTALECEYCNSRANPVESFAGIFCAKEAAVKAVKQGFGKIMPRDIEIVHDVTGAPQLVFHGNASEVFEGHTVDVSISHDGDTAVAVVEVL